MKDRKNIIRFLVVILLCFPLFSWANMAQPGVWSAGGTSSLLPLFPEDSVHVGKVRMQKEEVYISIYKGYAVVKGRYWMENLSDKDIIMKVGYPTNAHYEPSQGDLVEMDFGGLHGFWVLREGEPQALLDMTSQEWEEPPLLPNNYEDYSYDDDAPWKKWKFWEATFPAGKAVLYEVYFITNTNNGHVRNGYTSGGSANAFAYVLETGATWNHPIGKSSVIVRLADGLNRKDVIGQTDRGLKGYDKDMKAYLYQYNNLIPTYRDNIIMTYFRRLEKFDIERVAKRKDVLFKEMDAWSSAALSGINAAPVKTNGIMSDPNYWENKATTWGIVILGVLFLVVLPILVFAMIVRAIFRSRTGKVV